MTKNRFEKYRNVDTSLSDWAIPAPDGVHRRTLVQGAAWTIPVVGVSVATPAAAASNSPTLKFTKASYTGVGCKFIKGAQVKRTMDGSTADAGKRVTVTLRDGYTFKDGTTTSSATTDSSGLITLPDIKVPRDGGKSTFGAISDDLSTSAPVTGAKSEGALSVRHDQNPVEYADVPNGSTPVGGSTYITSDGDLYIEGVKKASNVKSAVGAYNRWTKGRDYFATYVTKDGVAHSVRHDQDPVNYTSVPKNATPLGGASFLTSDGKLYIENVLKASDVTSAVGEYNRWNEGRDFFASYVTKDGVAHSVRHDQDPVDYKDVPKKSTPVGGSTFLTDDGDLYIESVKKASKVKSAVGQYNRWTEGRDYFATYVDTDGVAHSVRHDTKPETYSSVPSGAKPVGGSSFLTSGGDLYIENTRKASNVKTAVGSYNRWSEGARDFYAAYTGATC
ncbi:hypothetical protein C5E02_00125 [Rathayibacter rathayi]|uniref:hypothetical protein n=1 Tax=Rathayibacter rathayi TaxID=33887 RepID=UPI000CE91231|nr:hypothetical protein [Rathayibacter rathayi]PPI65299.1 hypothetical protein C5E02_00125 [Rathayibacter rathayi]